MWGLGKQTWVMKGIGGYKRGLCGRSMGEGGKHSRVSLGSGELGSWGISPSPHTHSPKPPHLLPFWSSILGLSSWDIVTSCLVEPWGREWLLVVLASQAAGGPGGA